MVFSLQVSSYSSLSSFHWSPGLWGHDLLQVMEALKRQFSNVVSEACVPDSEGGVSCGLGILNLKLMCKMS